MLTVLPDSKTHSDLTYDP